MQILSIGNSFSIDATTYLHDMAKRSGVDIQTANLYIGGCPLEKHFRNFYSDERAYMLQYNGHATMFKLSIKEALLNRSWDVITLQQASHFSGYPDTYTPYIERLAEEIRALCPKAKLVLHQTWAYEAFSERVEKVAHFDTHHDMYHAIRDAYEIAAKAIHADGIIPCGDVMYLLAETCDAPVHRDTFHASLGIGRYALAMTWLHYLTGTDITDNDFNPQEYPLTEEEIALVKEIVLQFAPMAK